MPSLTSIQDVEDKDYQIVGKPTDCTMLAAMAKQKISTERRCSRVSLAKNAVYLYTYVAKYSCFIHEQHNFHHIFACHLAG